MTLYFICHTVQCKDRHIEPRNITAPESNYEEMTLTIELIGSGNTTDLSTDFICADILKRLETIPKTE